MTQAAWGKFKQACSSTKEIETLPCPSSSLEVRRVASISPRCLQSCPQLCKPIGAFMTTYNTSRDWEAVKTRGCDYTNELDCAFETAALPECKTIVSMFI